MTGDIKDLQEVFAVLIPLSAVVLGIAMACWSLYLEHQRKRLQYQERQLMIEKGMMPPPLPPDEKRRVTPHDALRRGIVMSFLGAGLGLATAIVASYGENVAWLLSVVASIVGFLGLGNLLYFAVSRKLAAKGQDADSAV
jgi:hypothetical protein